MARSPPRMEPPVSVPIVASGDGGKRMTDNTFESDRRGTDSEDRRKSRRGGRRPGERRRRWRRLGWLFVGYAVYVSVRTFSERARALVGRPSNR
jgi:hypothetical protein